MIQAICWTLVHSLWQGLLFAMAAGVVMMFTRKASAAVRYNVLCGLLSMLLLVLAGTFIYEWSLAGVVVAGEGDVVADGSRSWMGRWIEALGGYCSTHAVPIVWGWLFIFIFKTLRMMGSLLYTQRIRNYGISAPPGDWQQRVDMLAHQLGINRAVRLVESRIVKVPLVTGVFRPMIFIPMGLLTGLPEGEIEAVLLHELAHIRRNDYLVNFLQHLAENILFFNPGVLWMSALLRDERENCCDDIAIDRTRDRIQFVRALISFKEYDLKRVKLANAFPARKQQLLKRVTRIAHNSNKTLDPAEKVFLAVSSVLIFLLVAATSDHSRVLAAQVWAPKGNNRIVQDRPRLAEEEKTSVVTMGARVTEEDATSVVTVGSRVTEEDATSVDAVGARTVVEEDRTVNNSDGPVKADVRGMRVRSVYEQKVIADKETQRQKQQKEDAAADENERNKRHAQQDAEQSARDRQHAVRDQEQATRDREQALRDKKQAEMDAQQADRDRGQAERDRGQAERDKEQAIRDREQAERDRGQAEKDRQQVQRDKIQADRDAAQALKDARQSH